MSDSVSDSLATRTGEPGLDPLVLDAARDVLAARVHEQPLSEPSGS